MSEQLTIHAVGSCLMQQLPGAGGVFYVIWIEVKVMDASGEPVNDLTVDNFIVEVQYLNSADLLTSPPPTAPPVFFYPSADAGNFPGYYSLMLDTQKYTWFNNFEIFAGQLIRLRVNQGDNYGTTPLVVHTVIQPQRS